MARLHRSWMPRVLGFAAVAGAPLLINHSIAHGSGWRAQAALASLQIAVSVGVLARNWAGLSWRWTGPACVAAAALVLAVCRAAPRQGLIAEAALSHAALYALLLGLFAGSLRPGRTPLVTGLARRLHGSLTPARAAYTRGVTWLWAGFFAFQLTGSAVLLAAGAIRAWSLFVNVADLPLAVLLFALEFGLRCYRFRGQQRGTARDMLAALRRGRPS